MVPIHGPFICVTRYGVDEETFKQHITATIDGDYLVSDTIDYIGMEEFFFKIKSIELYQTNYCTVITNLEADRTRPSMMDDIPDIPASINHHIVNKASMAYTERK